MTRCSASPRTSSSTAPTPATSAACSRRSRRRRPTSRLDLAALERAIGPRTRAVLINSPNNPTGCIYDAATLRALGEAARAKVNAGREHPVFLVSDEPYRALAYDGADGPAGPPGLARSPW